MCIVVNRLEKGIFLKRLNRFVIEFKLEDGSRELCHTTNTGTMKSVLKPGVKVFVSRSENLKRKLKYTFEFAEVDGEIVGVNTLYANRIVKHAFLKQKVPEFLKYDEIKPEVSVGNRTRLDFGLLQKDNLKGFVEVKNVTLKEDDGVCYFPDAKTERGIKHLEELIKLHDSGFETFIVYVIRRKNCKMFLPATHIHKKYTEALIFALKSGVQAIRIESVARIENHTGKIKIARVSNLTQKLLSFLDSN